MADDKQDDLTMLYSEEGKDGDFVIDSGIAQGLLWITTTDIKAAKKAGWKSLKDAQKG